MSSITNLFGPFVPAGSYQLSTQDINITIMANVQDRSGLWMRQDLSFSTSQSNDISDIAAKNGRLVIVSGVPDNPYNEYGQFFPAGSYQQTCRDIAITISAQCEFDGNRTKGSQVSYATNNTMITDIVNQTGELHLEMKAI